MGFFLVLQLLFLILQAISHKHMPTAEVSIDYNRVSINIVFTRHLATEFKKILAKSLKLLATNHNFNFVVTKYFCNLCHSQFHLQYCTLYNIKNIIY